MASEISTWQRTKDVLLVGFAGFIATGVIASVALLMTTQKDIADLKVQLAIYQTQQGALRKEHDTLRADVDQHFREDRERFKNLGVR